MKIIGITGNSGVGKTTIAKELSKKLKCGFIDVDKQIIGSKLISSENNSSEYSKISVEQFELLINALKDENKFISTIINDLVESSVEELLSKNDTVIVEWMLLQHLKIWKKCNIKILIEIDEKERKINYMKNNLITEEEYEKCFKIVNDNYYKFKYDYIFRNTYDKKIIEEVLKKF